MVSQITSTGGTITVTPAGGTGVVNLEASGVPIASLAGGTNDLALTDVLPFEHLASATTERATVQALLGLGAIKQPINAVAVANLSMLSGVATTVDGVALNTAGMTVLLTAQSSASQNGPWVIGSGSWTRPYFYASGNTNQAYAGCVAQILAGTAYSGTFWKLATTGAITIDTTATMWSQIVATSGLVPSPAGADTQVQFNDGGSMGATSGLTFTKGTNTLTLGSTATAGTIVPPAAGTTSVGISLSIKAGPGGSTSGDGGTLNLSAGTSISGVGGSVSINGTPGTGTVGAHRAGGNIGIFGGSNSPAATQPGGLGGVVQIGGGSGSVLGPGGYVQISGGVGGSSSGDGGFVSLTGGSSATGTGGGVTLTAGTGVTGNSFVILKASNGVSALTADNSANVLTKAAVADQSAVINTTGTSATIGNNVSTYLLNPSGTVLAETLTMPAAPIDGQTLEILTTKQVTTLTLAPNSGQTMSDTFASVLKAGQGLRYRYNTTLTSWFRIL